jgi:hypothetical protein
MWVIPQERQKKKDVYKLISIKNSYFSNSIIHNSTQAVASSLVLDVNQTLRGALCEGCL